ncbi:MAG: hypothetical protein ACO3OJ_03910, partial [Paracoccaceae bacterium]
FGTNSGTVTINNNLGAFTVTPTADLTTEGAETFTVTESGTVGSTAVSATSASITINDTSLTPATPTYAIVKNSGNNAYEGRRKPPKLRSKHLIYISEHFTDPQGQDYEISKTPKKLVQVERKAAF